VTSTICREASASGGCYWRENTYGAVRTTAHAIGDVRGRVLVQVKQLVDALDASGLGGILVERGGNGDALARVGANLLLQLRVDHVRLLLVGLVVGRGLLPFLGKGASARLQLAEESLALGKIAITIGGERLQLPSGVETFGRLVRGSGLNAEKQRKENGRSRKGASGREHDW
jgi:hypothetical protein